MDYKKHPIIKSVLDGIFVILDISKYPCCCTHHATCNKENNYTKKRQKMY